MACSFYNIFIIRTTSSLDYVRSNGKAVSATAGPWVTNRDGMDLKHHPHACEPSRLQGYCRKSLLVRITHAADDSTH